MSVRRECRVTRIDTYIVGAKWCNWVFAHVFTDDGIEGVGEGTCEFQPKAVEAAIQQLARRVVVGGSTSFLWKRFDVGFIDGVVNGLGTNLNTKFTSINNSLK